MIFPYIFSASEEQIVLDDAHVPGEDAKDAFDEKVAESIKESIKKSRRSWKIHHESSMWARAAGLSDDELTSFSRDDLVQIRNGQASYGHVIFGKLRLPAVNDKLGEGYVHVRCGFFHSNFYCEVLGFFSLRCWKY